MNMLDIVQVITPGDDFAGEIGVIVDTDIGDDYPYRVYFKGREAFEWFTDEQLMIVAPPDHDEIAAEYIAISNLPPLK